MKTILLFALSLLLGQHCSSQVTKRLHDYYSAINFAEQAILDSNYHRAISFYEKAFNKRRPFAKDSYNYATSCALTGEFAKCKKQLVCLISRGASINKFKRNSAYNTFFKSKEGDALTKEYFTIPKSYNIEYRRQLDSLVNLDQHFRYLPGGYSEFGDTIRKIDSLNVIAFNSLINIYGFPTEEIIGIDSMAITKPIYELLILHNRTGAKFRTYDFSILFRDAMKHGQLEVHKAAEYVEMSTGISEWGIEVIRPLKCVYDSINSNSCVSSDSPRPTYSEYLVGFHALEPDSERTYNANRTTWSMERVDLAKKKLLYQLSDSRFDFTSSKLDIIVFAKKSDYERMMEFIEFPK